MTTQKANTYIKLIFCIFLFSGVFDLNAARERKQRNDDEASVSSEEAKKEYRANDILNRGLELLTAKQEDRGLKMIQSIGKDFPETKVRFKAFNALGEYFTTKRNYDQAVAEFIKASKSEDDEIKTKAMYQTGICYYNMNKFDDAFVLLRKVTNDYPWSVYANQSFYYIGLCHFKLKRWVKAVEALKMVGTSVVTDQEVTLAEAGQRLFTKLSDKDLIVLSAQKGNFKIKYKSSNGDEEELLMSGLGRSGVDFLGSIPTVAGEPVIGDGNLQIIGGDTVTCYYIDEQTEAGEAKRVTLSTAKMVSSATIGFTDGAYKEYSKGVFGDSTCFMRVKDLDLDVSKNKDILQVRVYSKYIVKKEDDYEKRGVSFDDEVDWQERKSLTLTLEESEAHSGVFIGSLQIQVPKGNPTGSSTENLSVLMADAGDTVVLEYIDHAHIKGEFDNTLSYEAKLLVGEIKDVKIEHREPASLEMKAKKNLLEAKIFLKLAGIFKEVGLNKSAFSRADQALEKIEAVISLGIRAGLSRDLIEDAFNVKWDTFLVKGELQSAISTCSQLIKMFPDSLLVDKALMKIGMAKLDSSDPEVIKEAVSIFNGILRLPKSALKAEAQFLLAEVEEKSAVAIAKARKQDANLSRAMMAYRKCSETYPESPFAGKSLEKVANYYLHEAKDYHRAIDLMEQVFSEYPDASFLDDMLIKWVVAAYRLGEFQVAIDKCERLLTEYPQSTHAAEAAKFKTAISKKLGN